MKNVYETASGPRKISLCVPFWRSALHIKKGYVIRIEYPRSTRIHPAFPGQFSSLEEMRQYMRDFAKRRKPEGYEGRIAEELVSYVRQKIREERTSRLFDRDNAYLVAEDLHALEKLRNELAAYEDLF
ncbi:MAG: hypothetical protein HY514_01045, partial [Candidatus Aenigmarchaeota archaeon]|nr:hypothetical protein [Candidatus Aenigmarchaeota archaeon]